MVNQELIDYIKKYKTQGTSAEEIKKSLLDVGWSPEDITKAFVALNNPDIPLPPTPSADAKLLTRFEDNNLQKQLSPAPAGNIWDAFEHILMFISMYTLATAIVIMLTQFIDAWVQKIPVNSYDSYSVSDTTVIGSLSAIIVSFPIFAYLFVRISNKTQVHPELRLLGSRKFLIYLTLVITFIILLTNTISLVYNFLRGDMSLNFSLKFFVYVAVSGIIFYYYMNQVKEDRQLRVA